MPEIFRKVIFNYVGRALLFHYHKVHPAPEMSNPSLRNDDTLQDIEEHQDKIGVSDVHQVDGTVNVDTNQQVANNMIISSSINAKPVNRALMDMLYDIKGEIAKLSKKLYDDNEEDSLGEVWRKAANVFDRLFLLMCTLCTMCLVFGLVASYF